MNRLINFEGTWNDTYDVVVVGAGAAGLYAALSVSEVYKVLVLAKSDLRTCNSNLAQGGIAMTLDGDYESHFEDTMKAGSYHNDPEIVRHMIALSPVVLQDLLAYGTAFDRLEDGRIALTAEGGHTKRRILHCKDLTGEGVMTALIQTVESRKNIDVVLNATALEILTDSSDHACGLIYEQNGLKGVLAPQVVIATGGIGGLFESTTNHSVVTGDGIAMAMRAGAKVKDMEFIQYHPTAMQLKSGGTFLISEAVRGEGGILIDDLGERFMLGKHPMNELAPRDVVSKAINEAMQSGRRIFVDVRHFEKDAFRNRFPNIYETCLRNGIDPETQPIPIAPVEHYFMGGIVTDGFGRTSIDGLYATGEAACSGFHGANRLASNSLLECLTLSRGVADIINGASLGQKVSRLRPQVMTSANQGALLTEPMLKEAYVKFAALFSKTFTIVKNRPQLEATLMAFEQGLATYAFRPCEEANLKLYVQLMNGLSLGIAIASAALSRRQSLGGFLLEEDQHVQ